MKKLLAVGALGMVLTSTSFAITSTYPSNATPNSSNQRGIYETPTDNTSSGVINQNGPSLMRSPSGRYNSPGYTTPTNTLNPRTSPTNMPSPGPTNYPSTSAPGASIPGSTAK